MPLIDPKIANNLIAEGHRMRAIGRVSLDASLLTSANKLPKITPKAGQVEGPDISKMSRQEKRALRRKLIKKGIARESA